jgi:hypothetical protein
MPFRETTRLAYQWATKKPPGAVGRPDVQVTFELLSRLRQLSWLYGEIKRLEALYCTEYHRAKGDPKPDTNYVTFFISSDIPETMPPEFSVEDQLRLLVESFYYIAHRLVTVLDQCQASLPDLKPVSAEAIRRVRNNLIEHANKQGGRFAYSFSISNAAGVRLRSAAPAGSADTFLDEGIHRNANDLAGELNTMLREAVAT